ncbi:glycosyltransferase family 4 protein [Paraburkholderia susongensis]|uniref:Glycosyltransferase involved in cell wall bisynthesis n=1 Tax=Paraburkholderia susongensis TaxID=1515439 RepID=A0A1X7JFT1_9BURK|nr:glycosyltransferase family 4 protein [Paraburkholderia susongensis]SMG26080.1 Glycosyltransferase involved in cell wall bisynthesis [Paraburkholderia susongensis]
MKIIHLANHAQSIGNGIVNVMVDLACSQARAGHDVTVASGGGGFEALLERHGVRHVLLAQAPKPSRVPAMVAGLNRLIARIDPDVVHAHMMTGALLARFGVLRRRYALVTTVHNEFQKSATLMRVGDRVVTVSEAVAVAMEARGIPRERLAVVRNGTVGTPRLAGQPMPASPALAHPCIVTLAGMYERKGIRDLLLAFALLRKRLPSAVLYLVGEGPDRVVMEEFAQQIGVAQHAHFEGFCADPRGYLAQADVFVLASHNEPAGLVLCEAREAGRAIVATRVGGIPEMLDGGEAGVLVPPHDPATLADAITTLLTDREAHAALAARASQGLEKFSVQRLSEAYLAVYERTLESCQPRRFAKLTARGTDIGKIAAPQTGLADTVTQSTTV